MSNGIIYAVSTQSASNLLQGLDEVNALIAAGVLASQPTFSNSTNYLAGDVVYYSGIYYIASVNISSGGGTPLVNTNWRHIPTWGSYTTTATAAGTTTLTEYSARVQRFSGSTTQTIVMPVVTTFDALGDQYYFINDSSGSITIQSSGANSIVVLTANQRATLTLILLTGTTAASWTYTLSGITAGDALVANPLSQFAATTSAQLAGVISDETGYSAGAILVFSKSPVLETPNVGVATATSINKVALTAPATSATLTILNGKTLTANNSLTLAGTDSTVMTFPTTSATIARTDAANTFTGIQTMTSPAITTANLIGVTGLNGDLQLAENVSILLDAALSADGKWSGICESGVIGDTTVLFGELLYFKAADSRWWRADSDAEATSGPVKLGICCVAGTAGDTRTIMLKGKINAASLYPALTVGAPCHIGATAGNIQVAAPTSGFVRVVGYANTADELYFNPDSSYYELGTFNFTLQFGGASTGITYTNQLFRYKKIYKEVFLRGDLNLSSKGSSTGSAELTGTPFTNETGFGAAISIAALISILYSGTVHGYLNSSSTTLSIYNTTELGTWTSLQDTQFVNASRLIFSMKYYTA